MNWDPVHGGRTAFLACMRALCAPGTPIELPDVPMLNEDTELDGAAAVLLALLDRGLELGVAGDGAANRVAAVVAGRTGAEFGDVADADWVLVHGPAAEAIARARRGGPLTPERGATLVIAASGDAQPMSLSGPGISGTTTAFVALDAVAAQAFTTVNAQPPAGVDLLVVSGRSVIGLPRSVAIHGVR
ncbi:phosphonate C-P lyase system protein PhnH [Mycobacterium sp. 21AC1]|uniref:phosphonate C-P lyase system protein PhnH n=1 Tax=[Mycobacterium] appelbergii TaxID=2939269 RepID=UPI0029392AA5|nr:phosphonate C-P lyase system protein PhnH [Mycobacterium sp. 21AC1]MDV3129745.1 phosphonate C-P lyase system protein PhnH [Mycobacterium sp. 21AC1]